MREHTWFVAVLRIQFISTPVSFLKTWRNRQPWDNYLSHPCLNPRGQRKAQVYPQSPRQAFRAVDQLPYHLNFLPESENHTEAPGHSELTHESKHGILSFFLIFFFKIYYYYYLLFYNIVLVLPYIRMGNTCTPVADACWCMASCLVSEHFIWGKLFPNR